MGKSDESLNSFELSKFEAEIDELYSNKYAILSNALIQAREKTSLLESKIELLAMYKFKDEVVDVTLTDKEGKPYLVSGVKINANEIKQLTGRKGNSLYNEIFKVSLDLKQKLYIYRDQNSNQFKMDNLYGPIEYNNGILSITFNPGTEWLLETTSPYTKLKIGICFKFQTNGGFQLYKLLAVHQYEFPKLDLTKKQEEQGEFPVSYKYNELRLQMGYVNLNQPEIKSEGQKRNPDIDRMNDLDKKPKYKKFNDFKKLVIEKGVEEINRISDIYISGIEYKKGAYGRYETLIFRVQHNVAFHSENKATEIVKEVEEEIIGSNTVIDEDDFVDLMREFIPVEIKIKDCKAIAKAADYNLELIKEKWELSENSNVRDIVSWMIDAIKKDYSAPVKREKKKDILTGKEDDEREYIHSNYIMKGVDVIGEIRDGKKYYIDGTIEDL